jgi:hypothetical protein
MHTIVYQVSHEIMHARPSQIERLEQLRMQLRGAFLAVRRARHSSVRQLSRRFASFGRSFGDLPAVAAAAESAAAAAAAAGGGAEGAAAAARAAEGVDGGLRLEVSDLPGVQDSVQYFAWQVGFIHFFIPGFRGSRVFTWGG